MDFSTVMIIVGCMIGLWIVGKIFSIPLKAIFKLVMNSILGGLLIFIINLIGGAFSFHIGLNVGTSLLVGILGIPRCYFINYIENIYIKNEQEGQSPSCSLVLIVLLLNKARNPLKRLFLPLMLLLLPHHLDIALARSSARGNPPHGFESRSCCVTLDLVNDRLRRHTEDD